MRWTDCNPHSPPPVSVTSVPIWVVMIILQLRHATYVMTGENQTISLEAIEQINNWFITLKAVVKICRSDKKPCSACKNIFSGPTNWWKHLLYVFMTSLGNKLKHQAPITISDRKMQVKSGNSSKLTNHCCIDNHLCLHICRILDETTLLILYIFIFILSLNFFLLS